MKFQYSYIDKQTTLLLSSSGGQDSLFLFIRTPKSIQYGTFHVHHLLSRDNFIFNKILRMHFFFGRKYHLALPLFQLSNEQKSATYRYRLSYRVAQVYNYNVLIFAKTQTDHIEKLFLNLFRGCGDIKSLTRTNKLFNSHYFLVFR